MPVWPVTHSSPPGACYAAGVLLWSLISITPEMLDSFFIAQNSKIKICTIIPTFNTHRGTDAAWVQTSKRSAEASLRWASTGPFQQHWDKQPNKTFRNLGYWHAWISYAALLCRRVTQWFEAGGEMLTASAEHNLISHVRCVSEGRDQRRSEDSEAPRSGLVALRGSSSWGTYQDWSTNQSILITFESLWQYFEQQ